MKKLFILLLISVALIPIGGAFAQSDPYERYIDSLCQAGLYEEAYQYAKQRWQSLSPDKSQAYKDATADYYRTTFMFEMVYRYQEKFEEALKLNEEMLALRKPETDYFAIRNKIVCYSGLGNYEKAAENRALLYKAHKKKKLPCEYELCHYYNFDFFKIDTLNIWGYEWYDELPKNRFSTSFTKVVYYVYSTHPDGSDKDQLYRLHLIMFHGTDMPFDYIMEKHISTENGKMRSTMYEYTYKEDIDYKKLHNDVMEIVKGGKKTDTRQGSHYRDIVDFNPDTVETVEPREKTEYIAERPYKEYDIGYDFILTSAYNYGHLNISLNGTVKSVVQTELPVILNSSETARQQTWKFSPKGHLYVCHINETSLKDILDYDINDDRTLSDDNFDSTDTISYYSFNSIGQLSQVIEEGYSYSSKETFEYDQNGHLTKVATYYWDTDVLSEEMITLNDDGKPVRVEERRNGVKTAGVFDAYCYDERGNRVAHQRNNGKTVQWMNYYVYDSLDNVIFKGRCRGYRGDNNNCKCKGFHKNEGFEYDDQHNMIRDYSIGDWKPSGWDDYYQRDSAGREIEYKHYDVRGEQRTFDRHIQTTYDSAGRMVSKEALLGSFRVNEYAFSYTRKAILEEWMYDEYGNLEQHVVYETKAKPFNIVRYQYKYDQHGNWVKRVRYEGPNVDSMTATEVMERKIEYYE